MSNRREVQVVAHGNVAEIDLLKKAVEIFALGRIAQTLWKASESRIFLVFPEGSRGTRGREHGVSVQ